MATVQKSKLMTIAKKDTQKKSGVPTTILFMGTPDFAVPAMEALIKLPNVKILGVITQPDRPVGRKHIITPPPVKHVAEKHNLQVFQPEKLTDDITKAIKNLAPDLIVVVAYGKIIPQKILDLPKFGSINVHASLLPSYRGASPIQAAIAAGERETGISIMLLDDKMDHGPVLARKEVAIASNETGESLFQKLAPLGARLLCETLPKWVRGAIKPREQNHEKATFCKLITREDGKIDWTKPAEILERKIRAYHPWPGSWTMWHKQRVHILHADVMQTKTKKPGTVFKTTHGFAIHCEHDALEIREIHLEGKQPMMSDAFLRGHPEIIGQKVE